MKFVLCVDLFDPKIVSDIKLIQYFIMMNRTGYILIRILLWRLHTLSQSKLVDELLHFAQQSKIRLFLPFFGLMFPLMLRYVTLQQKSLENHAQNVFDALMSIQWLQPRILLCGLEIKKLYNWATKHPNGKNETFEVKCGHCLHNMPYYAVSNKARSSWLGQILRDDWITKCG